VARRFRLPQCAPKAQDVEKIPVHGQSFLPVTLSDKEDRF
jgi:hypothetical protein